MTRKLATQTVRSYLDAMEAREIDKARALLAPGFFMIFPGGNRFTDLEGLVEWSRPRYQWVAKRYERYDEAPLDDATAVYCYGTLYGVWPDGEPFEGIRFIDRFTVKDGKLVDQLVWNDLAIIQQQRNAA